MVSRIVAPLLLLLLATTAGWCTSNPEPGPLDTLTFAIKGQNMVVGVTIMQPFIIQDDKDLRGLSITLWENIAHDLGISYCYVIYPDITSLLDAVEKGEIDISVNPLTVTSGRLQKMNFTQPFFITNLGIAVKSEKDGMFLRFVMRILSTPLFLGLAALMVVILVFGFLTWLFERRASDVEFSNNAKGLWDAFWWSAVTMTAVGYGDKAPKTIGGRVVAICWMLTSVVIISSYTAIIATSLTVNELELSIDNTKELRSAKIGTVALSTAESYLTDSKYDYEPFSSIQAALHGIAKGEIDAVVYDEPILNYEIQNLHLKNEIIIAPNSLSIEYYSFAIPFQRDITKEINLSLIKQIKSNDWKGELRKYSLK